MAFDFEREKEIDLGPLFPFETLGMGECLISQAHADKYKLKEGQIVELGFDKGDLWQTLERYYKMETEDESFELADTSSTSQV